MTQRTLPAIYPVHHAYSRRFFVAVALCASLFHTRPLQAADFIKPTPQELSMTSLPGYPGAAAVVLYREELTRDDLHSVQHYERVKILTEEGKKYANVELGYVSLTGNTFGYGDGKSLDDISGRTIHPDGTIVPFTGKPYLKVLEKTNGYKIQEKVFTLPDVEVGSIIEYRYFTRINDSVVEEPTWMIQGDLFVKEAHFAWWPTSKPIVDADERPINSISWFPVLPQGAKIETQTIAGSRGTNTASNLYEVHVKDVPPRVKEEYMPPIDSFSYRVNFSFTSYRSAEEYWQGTGKDWSKRVNSFVGPNGALRQATAKVIAGATTPEEKLRKIYAAVMALDNTRYTREHDQREDKAAGMGQTKEVSDVLAHERGTPSQLTELFVGMARAAGLNAYVMWVPDRSQEIFVPAWLSTRQLDDYIAIVNVNGQDQYFDPGSRYCPFGQLAWQHTMVNGLRQTADGTAIAQSTATSYKNNRLARVANLTMDAQGEVTGKVDLTFTGSEAVRWRQAALRGDEESLRKDLRHTAEEMLPRTLAIEVAHIQDLTTYEAPLKVSYSVKGTIGTAMGKRTALPADVFLANTNATFPHEKRETPVYFEYPRYVQDAVRINLPSSLAVEAAPADAQYSFPKIGAYTLKVIPQPNNVTTRREFVFADVLVQTQDYPTLRSFYAQMESKDQEQVILKAGPAVTASASAPSQSK